MAMPERISCDTVASVVRGTDWLKADESFPEDPVERREYILAYLKHRLVGKDYSGIIRPTAEGMDNVVFCLPRHLLDIGGDCSDVRQAVIQMLTTEDDEQVISQVCTREIAFNAGDVRCTVLRNGDVRMVIGAEEFMHGGFSSKSAPFIDQFGLRRDLKKTVEKTGLQFLPSEALNRTLPLREQSHKRPQPVGELLMRGLFKEPLRWQRCVYDFETDGEASIDDSRMAITVPFDTAVARDTFIDRLLEVPLATRRFL